MNGLALIGTWVLAGLRYFFIGVFVLAVGYAGTETWIWMKQSPVRAEGRSVNEPARAPVGALAAPSPLPDIRTARRESEAVFVTLKQRIKALEKEVAVKDKELAAMKLDRQTRMAQLSAFERARLSVQDDPPRIVDLHDEDMKVMAKSLFGIKSIEVVNDRSK